MDNTGIDRRALLRLLGIAPLAHLTRHPFDAISGGVLQAGPGAAPDVELLLTAAQDDVPLLPRDPTRAWRFSARVVRGPASTVQQVEGSYLGPVIRLCRGDRVRIRFRNELGEPSIVHWHGLDVPELADGHPRLAIDSGGEYVYDFDVANRAGTYWYHPHPHMRTGAQVYRGLAGLLLVSDPEEDALGLPSGDGELLCVVQDRLFDARNQLVYPDLRSAGGGMRGGMGGRGMGRGGGMAAMMTVMNGWLGDRVFVNGQLNPIREVRRRTCRVRLLNGSNARFYKFAWSDGTPMVLIGADGGLLERPHTQRAITLGPAQRADVLLDLSGHAPGAEVRLVSDAFPAAAVGSVGMMAGSTPLPQGAPINLMTLRVTRSTGPRFTPPDRLSTHEFGAKPEAPVRRVPLTFTRMTWLLGGRLFEMDDVAGDETVAPGSTHIWELANEPNPMGMAMAHPIHLHGRHFRVLSRTGGGANALRDGINDDGWLDTVVVLPGETVRIQTTFSRHPGLYLYHCHTLEHEDMGMMRNFRIRG
jgi:FtsP/CotA-like multicopper oxidase with cupredoxin domain